LTAGFDANTKTDAGYNSKKRMLVAGPTLMIDVPGFLNVSLLALWESNAPYNTFSKVSTPRYSYGTHPMLTAAWGIPLGSLPVTFEGFANFIAAKGKNEFGDDTKAETNIDKNSPPTPDKWSSAVRGWCEKTHGCARGAHHPGQPAPARLRCPPRSRLSSHFG
ncbi:hypothetical protein ACVBEH_04535, partial [Roseateles sp. GG27B]